jgi:hypothetical protein
VLDESDRTGGFLYSYVTKMLMMTSNGNVSEIEGDELKYWRSSAGQLGIILAVEMQLIREADKGKSLNMKSSLDRYLDQFANQLSPTTQEIGNLVQAVANRVYELIATSDHVQFIYNFYMHDLLSLYSDFSGPAFNATLSVQYATAAQQLLQVYGQDVAFTGGKGPELPNDLCKFFCEGEPCVPIESPSGNGKLCENPLEVAAGVVTYGMQLFQAQYQVTSSSVNDGYVIESPTPYAEIALTFPSRAFPQVFGTWLMVNLMSLAAYVNISGNGIDFRYIPNAPFEFRFINPKEAAVMNPIKPFSQWKDDFNSAYFETFDNFFNPIVGEIGIGWFELQLTN